MESEKKTTKKTEYIYAKGARKTAIAQVRLFKAGKGDITINDKSYTEYFPTKDLQNTVVSPLEKTGFLSTMDASIKVCGGGKVSQAGACRHGLSRALVLFDEALRSALKVEGYLTRDPRVKERKKPGLRRARRAPQWSKR